MQVTRRWVLAGVVLVVGALTAVILYDVWGTVFFAMTIAYVFAPVYRTLCAWGIPRWHASGIATTVVLTGMLALLVPPVLLVYYRRNELIDAIQSIPATLTLSFGEFTLSIQTTELETIATSFLRDVAIQFAADVPVVLVKFGLFCFLVFALFLGQGRALRAFMAVVPERYEDVVEALIERSHDTLTALYVLQGVTALATFVVAVPVFTLLGYGSPLALATVAGILQFAPVIGPSVLVGALAVYHLAMGQVQEAILVAVVAGVLVAWLPDPVVRPRLARRTADLPGSLYFVGFTGGVFSLGPVGIIAGPLVVALFVESVGLLSDELNSHDEAVPPDSPTEPLPGEPDEAIGEVPDVEVDRVDDDEVGYVDDVDDT